MILLIKIILKIFSHFGVEKDLRDFLVKPLDHINGVTRAQRAGAICSWSHSKPMGESVVFIV